MSEWVCVCVFGCHANSRWVLIKMYVSWAHFVSKRSPQFHGPPMPRKVYECDLRRIYCWQHGANFVCVKEGRESGKKGKQSTSNCFLFLKDFSIYNGLFMAWCLHCASRAIADCVWRISHFFVYATNERKRRLNLADLLNNIELEIISKLKWEWKLELIPFTPPSLLHFNSLSTRWIIY